MFKLFITNLKHVGATLSILCLVLVGGAVLFGVDIHYGDNPLAYKVDGEGPHVFVTEDNYSVEYVRGNREEGFYVDRQIYPLDAAASASVFFPLEGSHFDVTLRPQFETAPTRYEDGQPILAISDIESGYKTFRDFLIQYGVIDQGLKWTFNQGHLVLVGDFVDRGFSTTQTLWFIYKLEQEARELGGRVHFILGNHEIKNLQGNFQKAAYKYFYVAALLGRQQWELFGEEAFLGRWLMSKNTMEVINGYAFVHGGLHPKVVDLGLSLDELNQTVRAGYREAYYPKRAPAALDILNSSSEGPAWYRGYFEGDLSQSEVERGLRMFDAVAIVVGHTPQNQVSQRYAGRVFAIDVKHPQDYRATFPPRHSEALLIEASGVYRLLDDGTRIPLSDEPVPRLGLMDWAWL